MSIYTIKPVDRSHNTDMLNILRSSPNSAESLTVCFDRHPDFFTLPEIRYNPYCCYGFFNLDQLKGFGAIGYHTAMVNGLPSTVFHLRDYYVDPEARGKGFGYKVTEFFFRETYNQSQIGYAVIMAGNRPSLSYVGRRNAKFPYIPYSRILNQLDVRNIMLAWPVRNSRTYRVRKADINDIPEIVFLLNNEHKDRLFGNIYNTATFKDYLGKRPGLGIGDYLLAIDKAGKVCGVCAAWDCSSFRQTRVLKYGKPFRKARILYKGLALVFNMQPLPLQGECFRDAIITDYAARDRDPEIMNALLRSAYNDLRERGFQNMMWGSSVDDPLLKASESFFFQRVVSNIVLVSTIPELMESARIRNYLPFIDIPCL
jgi:ribosomal protein S18 acetylase RimI-like enzyme